MEVRPNALRVAARWLQARRPRPEVRTPSKAPEYIAAFLTPMAQARLLRDYPPIHGELRADHMTIAHSPTEEEVEALRIGRQVKLKVVGYAADDRGQAVVVVPKGARSERPIPHITISKQAGTGSVYSNALLALGYEKVVGPTLDAVLDTYPRRFSR